jgi:hypothetical protein
MNDTELVGYYKNRLELLETKQSAWSGVDKVKEASFIGAILEVKNLLYMLSNKKVTISLSLADARLLQGIMQNPLHGEDPALEDEALSDMRRRLFDTLKEVNGNV